MKRFILFLGLLVLGWHSNAQAPANDECANAISLDAVLNSNGTCTLTETYDNTGATFSAEEGPQSSTCTNADADTAPPDIWFTVTVPSTGQFTFDDITTPGFSNVTEFYTGSCGDLTPVPSAPCNNSGAAKTVAGLTPGEIVYIRIWDFGQNDFGTGELCVSFETCPDPTNLNVTDITTDSATLNWDDITEATLGYEWSVYESPSDPSVDTAISSGLTSAGETSVPVTGLMAGTEYDFYVSSDCDTEGQSVLAGPESFFTECFAATVDYEEDFENFLNPCWDEATGTAAAPDDFGSSSWVGASSPQTNSDAARYNMYINTDAQWLVSQTIDLGAGSPDFILSYNIAATVWNTTDPTTFSEDDNVGVAISTDDGASWTDLINYSASNTPSNTGQVESIDLSAYSGEVQFGIYAISSASTDSDHWVYFDDFFVGTAPTCPEPTDLTVSNLTTSSVDINWTDDALATNGYAWSIYTSPSDLSVDTPVDSGTTAAGETMAQSTLLMPQTDYDVYLSADCDDGPSSLAGPVTFTTPCATASVDYEEDFENFLNPCWDEATGTAAGPVDFGSSLWSGASSPQTNSGAARYNMYTITEAQWLVSQTIDLGAGSPDFVLSYNIAATVWNTPDPTTFSEDDNVGVAISTDGGASWTDLINYSASNTPSNTGQVESIDLSAYSGEVQFGIYAISSSSTDSDHWVYFDDFFVGTPASPASVQVIHNSADPSAQLVDVYVNGVNTLDDFAFRTASPFVDVPAGTPVSIDVAPSSSVDVGDSIFNLTTTLVPGESYIVVANGVLDPTQFDASVNTIDFELSVFAGAQQASTNAGENSILVHHGSTDAPTVDVVETSVPLGTVADDISYSEFQGYVDVPNADYVINVELADNSAVVASYEANLDSFVGGNLSDLAITVLASGFLDPVNNQNGPAFGLWAAVPTGGPLVELPLTNISTTGFELGNFSFYPNPASNMLNLETLNQVEEVRIFNILGQEVKVVSPNTVSPSVNVEGLQAGTYLMNVTINGASKSFKFIKE